ncbi:uncharacterized protein F5Z01DRAFT_459281 [Emericellopsis atlantica]|uniref:Erythromycin esterase n=1 Tax=Emericellopsis atlantica TaxID=2614577 RepID=A0A9P7ZSY1_9HYPO|nr:uncharacterized protein F5Z01DRAFT_459281 [Emericellopsis atlantica]KAG9257226.1 hypothetical protein F5Z01DRAFT_459281 [Emericellopsis atlantica]
MSPPRRRSSRLAAVGSAVKTRATPELPSVAETDDSVQKPAFKSPKPNKNNADPGRDTPRTPKTAPRPAPSHEDMHPSQYHKSTMPEPSSDLRLGFSEIRPGNMDIPGVAQATPTRLRNVPATDFTFRFAKEGPQMPLSENAQRLMKELREQANKIKADLRAQREAETELNQERKIAQPKGKSSRFSAAHMREFKKMDSIENHASAWRAQRTTPVKVSSPAKSNTEGTPTTPTTKPSLKRTLSKTSLLGTPQAQVKSSLKRTSSHAQLDDGDSQRSAGALQRNTPMDEPKSTFAKRVKKLRDDDTSKSRPMSRDGSTIPRPTSRGTPSKGPSSGTPSGGDTPSRTTSTISRLTSPTKASLGHSLQSKKSTISLVNTSPESEATTLPKPRSTTNLGTPLLKANEIRRRVISPVRFENVKSILRGQKSVAREARTALPKPSTPVSRTPVPTRTTDKELPPVPLTTPRRRLVKHVAFTPDTKYAAETPNRPSPQKFGQSTTARSGHYSSMDSVLAGSKSTDTVVYPDLSAFKDIVEAGASEQKSPKPSAPGTFTFRADHTIDFGATSPAGFGARHGQASIRQVGASSASKALPGSFPEPFSPSADTNKENKAPTAMRKTIPHGIVNKKRHRAVSDDDDTEKEADERAGKRRKAAAPDSKTGPARRIVSTPLASAKKLPPSRTPSKTPGSVSPIKKGGLSLSRLNMLARPKNRT